MTDGTSTRVECPVCGEEFDPSAAGGWCTNSECGEWQYIGEEVPEPTETPGTPDGGSARNDDGTDASGAEPSGADAESVAGDEPAAVSSDEPDEEPDDATATDAAEPDAADPDTDAVAVAPDAEGDDEVGADEGSGSAADDMADDPPADPADEAEPTPDEAVCPDCDSEVAPDANFCPNCGSDLESVAPAPLEACPACDSEVDEDDSFCANCGEDLDAARAGAADADMDGDTDADATAADEESGSAADDAAAAPESLVLGARGETITVGDGDTVGREARRMITDNDGDEDDAVLIHREHVRFVREDGRFYVVDLGDNPTEVNGTRLSKGDREPIAPGDELALSGVVTLAVDAP